MNNIDGVISQNVLNYLDFSASTVAFLEWQGKVFSIKEIEENLSEDELQFYSERLEYYRGIYKPK